MDKQEVLKEYRKTEDRILLSQVLDKIEIAEKRNQIQYTDFLDMYQVALVKKFLNKISYKIIFCMVALKMLKEKLQFFIRIIMIKK